MMSELRASAAELWPQHRELLLCSWKRPDSLLLELEALEGGGACCVSSDDFAEWELVQAELLSSSGLPAGGQQQKGEAGTCGAGTLLWCHHPGCTNLSGPSELQLKTLACGGGCGARYCSRACQEAAWRQGHRLSCRRMRALMRDGPSDLYVSSDGDQPSDG